MHSGLVVTLGRHPKSTVIVIAIGGNNGIRKYSSTSYVGMGWVQNGVLYLRYRSDFVIMKGERCKAFTYKKPSLLYSRKCSQASANLSKVEKIVR